MAQLLPSFDDVMAAARRIAPHAHRTPIMTSRHLDELTRASLYFKCESLQRVGAFKFRGACNAVLALTPEEARAGVVTHSSGNHGQALALAAKIRGIKATVVMPENSAVVKRTAVEGYGANVVTCAPGGASRNAATRVLVEATGAHLIHSHNDAHVIAGQGTAALELLQEMPGLDAIIAPVGGGGLLSGTALAIQGLQSDVEVFGAEPAAADDAYQSLVAGKIVSIAVPRTIADGLRTSALGTLTFAIIHSRCKRIITVSEEDIISAMRLVWERMKLVIEPSSAVAVAALLAHGQAGEAHPWEGRQIGVIVSGGNVDLDALPWRKASS